MNRAIIIDRDGVLIKELNGGRRPPWNEEELEFLPDIRESIQDLHDLGFKKVLVVSNQPDVRDDLTTIDFITYIDSVLKNTYGCDDVMNSYIRGTWSYKPNPGMIEQFQRIYDIDLSESWMIGNSWKDCVCAKLSGIPKYIHIGKLDPIGPCLVTVNNLKEAVSIINKLDWAERSNGLGYSNTTSNFVQEAYNNRKKVTEKA